MRCAAAALAPIGALACVLLAAACSEAPDPEPAARERSQEPTWSEAQRRLLRSLALRSLGEPPEVPSNRVAGDPRAARLGRELFFDPGLSRAGAVACETCHAPERFFTDGKRVSHGVATTSRNAPTVVGAAFSPWQFWDGRRDSLWSQALAPLEASAEMGSDRLRVVRYVTTDPRYRGDYAKLFGSPPDFTSTPFPEGASPYGERTLRDAWAALPEARQREIDRAFSNVGKAIAAYERLLVPAPAPFDHFVESLLRGDTETAESWLAPDQVAGLRLFLDAGRTQCLRCHNGPLFSNQSFHDVATSRLGRIPDFGRFLGLQSLLLDPFNCLGPYSDAGPESCSELRFLAKREPRAEMGAFKTPTLRDVARTAPYFHDGSVPDLLGVMEHYRAPPGSGGELIPLELDDREIAQLVAFLDSLSGGWTGDPATTPVGDSP